MDITFRPATNTDGSVVRALVAEVLTEYGLPSEPNATDACLQDIEQNYFKRGGYFEVLHDQHGRILGCYGLYPLKDSVCELRKMYFAKPLRGQGYGKKTMTQALEMAKKLGFCRIELETARPLVEAVGLYKKFGFQEFTKTHLPDRCDRAMFLHL